MAQRIPPRPMPTPLSRVIRARLAYLDISKEQLADRSGLGRSTIFAFSSGRRSDPQGSTLRKLAQGLAMTPGELLEQVNGTPRPASTTDKRIVRIVELLSGVPEDRLDAIESVVEMAAVQPVSRRPRIGRRDGTDTRQKRGRRQIESHNPNGENPGLDGGVPSWQQSVNVLRVSVPAFLKRLCADPIRKPAMVAAG